MKKTLLIAGVVASFCIGSAFAQRKSVKLNTPAQNLKTAHNHDTPLQRCSTPQPSPAWDTWFNALVEKYQQDAAANKMASMPSYTIPVIVHVIHNGEAVGTGSNISNAQVNSQIAVLNADFAGTGFNSGNCPSAFLSLKANTGLTFCMATKDELGNTLAVPGIDRVNRNTAGFSAPPYSNTGYIDGTIKPNTIWDPTLYCNIWVLNLGGGLLGYATFPTGTGLSGITGTGTASDDGVVIGYNYFGNVGTVSAPYDEGRTTTHEIGHWLGLRHINGDSNCGNDFVSDTPTQDQLHGGCIASSSTYHAGFCSGTTGEMTMNFMDYTDDACMYMFTNGQSARFQTCMANGTYRSGLNASAVNLCNIAPVVPVASFTFPGGTHCAGQPYTFTDASSGPPTSWAWSTNPSAGVTINTATSQSPTITFTNPGTYSVTLTATNAQGSDADVQTFVVTSCVGGCDTLSNYNFGTDTPSLYGSGGFGFASGHNDYLDKAKADFFAAGSYPAGYRITEAFYYFAKNYDGTGGASTISCKVWNDNGTAGAPNTAFTPNVSLNISALDITGAGNQVTFSPSIDPANGGFYVGFDGLVYNGTTGTFDSVAILTNADGESVPVTAWEQWSDNSWHSFNDGTNNTWQLDLSLCIAVVLCDPTTGTPYILNPTNEVIVYPNPATNTLYVNTNSKKEGMVTIKLMNVMGQVVSTKSVPVSQGGTYDVDLSNVGSGVYFINISTPEKSVTKRFVIEK